MRIAQVAPLFESVPPQGYGGTERVVSYLTEELVRQGHEVTLYASGDSETKARLIPCCPRSLRTDETCIDQLAHQLLMAHRVIQDAANYDLIHFHIDYLHFPLSQRQSVPYLTTLHGRLDIPDLQAIYRVFPKQPLVSISDSQRWPLPRVNWLGTVYHGLPEDLFTFRKKPGQYLAFLGRISREKRPDRAIRVAQQAGIPLKIAAKVDKADYDYYKGEIEPMIRKAGRSVEFIGEVGGREKDEFLGNALAMLFPIDWPEPFGLVMIEAMACGTPVITRPCGSVPEVMKNGVTGFVVDSDEAELHAVRKVGEVDRRACRRVFEKRFAASRMAADYVAIYRRLIETKRERGSIDRRGARATFRAVETILARNARGRRAPARSTLATLDPE